MPSSGQELEVKFFLSDLAALRVKLEALGARLVQPRVHEINLRFDTPDNSLTREYRVLRLRQDTEAHLTYKGPGWVEGGVRARQELEFTVSDFDTARALLEALGYQVNVMYEKYRTTYTFETPGDSEVSGRLLVTLDEMPYGHFAEVEGPDSESIRGAVDQLGLDWEKRILDSYLMLFERLRQNMGLPFRDLSFANFEGVKVRGEDLGME